MNARKVYIISSTLYKCNQQGVDHSKLKCGLIGFHQARTHHTLAILKGLPTAVPMGTTLIVIDPAIKKNEEAGHDVYIIRIESNMIIKLEWK